MNTVQQANPQEIEKGERPWYDARLRIFFAAKSRQARDLASIEGKPIALEVWPYFEAGEKGDWETVAKLWEAMRKRAHQYEGTARDETLTRLVWSPVLETNLAWTEFSHWDEHYVLAYGNDIMKSIPAGSVYFGGTDPGRGVITAMSESHADGQPFFTITQNALADRLYLEYLGVMYGTKIQIPTHSDAENCFKDYIQEATRRLDTNQLQPGEDVQRFDDGRVQVKGQVAVMAINARLVKLIWDRNSDREFFIEESFPLDWMYPHLSPHGLIMKINRQPLGALSEAQVRQDHEFWKRYMEPILGSWLKEETSVRELASFAEKIYRNRDFAGFEGDRRFIENEWPQKAFSKLRSAIGGIYAWRAEQAVASAEKERMLRAADFAFRQALALCPFSPEALFRYGGILAKQGRNADALLLAETSERIKPNPSIHRER